MQKVEEPIESKAVITERQRRSQYLEDYSILLDKYQLKYKVSEYYLEVGQPPWVQGWIVDVSIIPVQMEALLEAIVPYLIQSGVSFKVAKDAKIGRAILGGELGYLLLGKFVAIYPPDECWAVTITRQLIELTRDFRGPEILTDRRLAGIVYTRFGAGKPVMVISDNGTEESCIYDSEGVLMKDPFNIPFSLPRGIRWPFDPIATVKPPKKETVLQDKYKPMAILKEDAKGSVRKGLYLEKTWRIKWCVIKEARQNMFGDSMGRDMRDRLRWQYELHKDLEDIVPLPKIYDFFEENGDAYLVMEFIKGDSLTDVVSAIFNNSVWTHLSGGNKMTLLSYAIGIVQIIERMHKRGYIHRDITPGNFLIGKGGQIWMIDLELSYSEKLKKPSPPFRLGTSGFMSPEQQETLKPTAEQDIYAIGSLMIFLLTGLMPDKFALEDQLHLRQQISFFVPNEDVVNMIANCLQGDPGKRPDISTIVGDIERFRSEQLTMGRSYDVANSKLSPNKERLRILIGEAINGLQSPVLLGENQLWLSRKEDDKSFSYYQNAAMSVYTHFYQGLSGIVWLLAQACEAGFAIESCFEGYKRNCEFILESLDRRETKSAGLFFGTAGAAVALAKGVSSGLIADKEAAFSLIKSCLHNDDLQEYGLANGFAGQGVALLEVAKVFDEPAINLILGRTVEKVLLGQQPDGSWMTNASTEEKSTKYTGLKRGSAGIISFLLSYAKRYKDNKEVRMAAAKALDWLIRQSFKKRGHTRWNLHFRTKASSPDVMSGCSGVVLSLIKAYEVLGNDEYRILAEDCMRGYSFSQTSPDITQARGLSGVGEVCLAAAKVFRSDEWQEKADRIAQFIMHHYRRQRDGSCFWMVDGGPFPTAGFMEGNAGVIGFLLKCYDSSIVEQPLFAL